jgi:hypothetical protein
VHQRLLPFAAHRLDKAERSQRIDEGRRALFSRGAVGQDQRGARVDQTVLRIHRTGDHRHQLAQQRLRLGRIACGDDRAGAFVAHRQRLAQPGVHRAHRGLGHGRHDLARRIVRTFQIGRGEQQAKIRRIDRRRFDPHQNLVPGGFGQGFFAQFDNQATVGFKRRDQLCV